MSNEAWGTVRESLKDSVGTTAYTAWIEPLKFTEAQNGVANFIAPTAYVGSYVGRHFGDDIVYGLRAHGVRVERVAFAVSSDNSGARPSVETKSMSDEVQSTESVFAVGGAKLDPRAAT